MDIRRIKKVSNDLIKDLNDVFVPGEEDAKSDAWDLENAKEFVNDSENIFLLAYEGEEIVGMATAYKLCRMDKRGSEIFFYEIGVTAKFRKRGVGKIMVEELKRIGRQMGADEMFAFTERSNVAAMKLYESTGGEENKKDDVLFSFKPLQGK